MTKQKFINNLFHDAKGKLVLFQSPNPPLAGWICSMLISHLPLTHSLKLGFASLATGFLFTWAYLEITSGVNYFRRLLGIIILFAIIVL